MPRWSSGRSTTGRHTTHDANPTQSYPAILRIPTVTDWLVDSYARFPRFLEDYGTVNVGSYYYPHSLLGACMDRLPNLRTFYGQLDLPAQATLLVSVLSSKGSTWVQPLDPPYVIRSFMLLVTGSSAWETDGNSLEDVTNAVNHRMNTHPKAAAFLTFVTGEPRNAPCVICTPPPDPADVPFAASPCVRQGASETQAQTSTHRGIVRLSCPGFLPRPASLPFRLVPDVRSALSGSRCAAGSPTFYAVFWVHMRHRSTERSPRTQSWWTITTHFAPAVFGVRSPYPTVAVVVRRRSGWVHPTQPQPEVQRVHVGVGEEKALRIDDVHSGVDPRES